jgi:hypothetical protein
MLDDQINTRPSPQVVDSFDSLVEYLEMQPCYPCIDDNMINIYKYLDENLQTILDIFHEQQETLHSSSPNDQMDIGSLSSFNYPESPPSSTVSHSSHNNDENSFEPTE